MQDRQIPNAKLQIAGKLQCPKLKNCPLVFWELQFGYLFGAWSLGFGASDALRPLRREFLNCIEALLIP
jgi:hypothetical protein